MASFVGDAGLKCRAREPRSPSEWTAATPVSVVCRRPLASQVVVSPQPWRPDAPGRKPGFHRLLVPSPKHADSPRRRRSVALSSAIRSASTDPLPCLLRSSPPVTTISPAYSHFLSRSLRASLMVVDREPCTAYYSCHSRPESLLPVTALATVYPVFKESSGRHETRPPSNLADDLRDLFSPRFYRPRKYSC